MKKQFLQQLIKTFPDLQSEALEDLTSDNLLSPFIVDLPVDIHRQAEEIIRIIFNMRESAEYLRHYSDLIAAHALQDPGNKSIMMSYDFHIDEQQQLKLIEINTNASFLILGHEMYKAHGLPLPVDNFRLEEIRENIETEWQLNRKTNPTNSSTPSATPWPVAITDDKPQEQKLYIEFLAYQQLFKSWGWDCRILDYRDLFQDFKPEFIYNRFTDFFLQQKESALLREKFLDHEVCLSPNPFEYLLLADKQRLIDWHSPGFLDSMPLTSEQRAVLRRAVPLSYDLTSARADEFWARRKEFFFKPKNAFGSKFSYRGGSISRKAYDEALHQDTIAQEFVPAPEKIFETPEGPQKFKYDLRCYAYQGRMQMIVARLYQGQVTNLRTTYGGFAPLRFF